MPPTRCPRRSFLAASLGAALPLALGPSCARSAAPQASPRGLKIQKAPPVVARKTFDRRDPPPEMPPLGPRADAVTHFRFGCSTNASYEVTSRRRHPRGRDISRRRGGNTGADGNRPGGCTATARINDLTVQVELEITIWLPRGARQKLIDHEEGHRIIAERVYATAERAARDEALKWVGRTVTGRANDCATAADAAVREASHKFCEAYLDATSGWSGRVGDLYDQITDHGRRDRPGVPEAIELAFDRASVVHPQPSPRAARVHQ